VTHDDPSTATVQVWVAPLFVPASVRGPLIANLSLVERARAERYRRPEDARRYAVARGWLRQVLGAETGHPPAEVPMDDGGGKPRLSAGAGPRFNLSHAGELALVAVAECEVGVDVEHRESGQRALDATALACTPAEVADLDRLAPDERAEAFLRIWTAKEAYLKARGVGLALPPHRVELGEAASVGVPVPVRVTGEPGPTCWWVRELRPLPDYVGAVAAEGPDWTVVLRSTAELRLGAPTGRNRPTGDRLGDV